MASCRRTRTGRPRPRWRRRRRRRRWRRSAARRSRCRRLRRTWRYGRTSSRHDGAYPCCCRPHRRLRGQLSGSGVSCPAGPRTAVVPASPRAGPWLPRVARAGILPGLRSLRPVRRKNLGSPAPACGAFASTVPVGRRQDSAFRPAGPAVASGKTVSTGHPVKFKHLRFRTSRTDGPYSSGCTDPQVGRARFQRSASGRSQRPGRPMSHSRKAAGSRYVRFVPGPPRALVSAEVELEDLSRFDEIRVVPDDLVVGVVERMPAAVDVTG